MDAETFKQLLSLGTGHKWLPFAILFVMWLGSVARKESVVGFLNIPARAMPFFVAGFGIIAGVLIAIQDGATPGNALQSGLTVATTSGFLYDLIVKGIFGGFENVPQWMRWVVLLPHVSDGSSTRPPKPPSITPPAVLIFIALGSATAATGIFVEACTPAEVKPAVDGAKTLDCIFDRKGRPDAEVVAQCATTNFPPDDVIHLLQVARSNEKAAYSQGRLEGEHLGCGTGKDGGK